MFFLPGVVGFLLMLPAEARVGNSSELHFCTETEECLLYDLVCQTPNYEVRHYQSVKWVATEEYGFFMELAAMRAFHRLLNYIKGENHMGKKMKMTSPVVVKIMDKGGMWQMRKYKMSFLLPSEHQMHPPKPTDYSVKIYESPDVYVYVRSYCGWIFSFTDRSTTNSLCAELDEVKAKYMKGFHLSAAYNSPMTLWNRHNEVWVVADGKPACPPMVYHRKV